jgi:hypothetical protein
MSVPARVDEEGGALPFVQVERVRAPAGESAGPIPATWVHNVPCLSPIYNCGVHALKTGRRSYTLRLPNVLYAQGGQEFTSDIQELVHEDNSLLGALASLSEAPKRVAVISHIEFSWLERLCPEVWDGQQHDRHQPQIAPPTRGARLH